MIKLNENTFYWIFLSGHGWEIALHLQNGDWLRVGSEVMHVSEEFNEINPLPIMSHNQNGVDSNGNQFI